MGYLYIRDIWESISTDLELNLTSKASGMI